MSVRLEPFLLGFQAAAEAAFPALEVTRAPCEVQASACHFRAVNSQTAKTLAQCGDLPSPRLLTDAFKLAAEREPLQLPTGSLGSCFSLFLSLQVPSLHVAFFKEMGPVRGLQ